MFLNFSILVLILILSLLYENRIKTSRVEAALNGVPVSSVKTPIAPWIILFALITFYAYCRTTVNDTHIYVKLFNDLKPSWTNIQEIISDSSKDKGFYILENLFKLYISQDYHIWFLFIAAIESIILINVFHRESIDFLDAAYYFFVSQLYYNYFTMTRQWLAICIVFAGYSLIKKKKFIPFLILCIFAAQFHNSAYLMIPIFFLLQGEAWGIKHLVVLAVFGVVLVFIEPILNSLDSVTNEFTYGYVIDAMKGKNGSSFLRAVIAAFPVVLAFIARDRITDRLMNICVNASIVALMLSVVASFTSGLYVSRLKSYLTVFTVLLFPYLLNVAYKDNEKRIVKLIFYGGYLIVYYVLMVHENSFAFASDIHPFLNSWG